MAFDVKYRLEFKDFFGIDWKVEISDETAASGIAELAAKENPLKFDFLSNGGGVIDYPVKGSTLDLQIYSETNFAYVNLYSYGNLTWRVQVYHGATLYWQGFINSDGYQEPYDQVPYYLTLQASDGLGQLKNIEYKDSGEYYNGRKLESEIVIDILNKISFTGFAEYVNLYEDNMANAVGDSPFDQCKIDADVFKDMYCYEVLEAILKKYNACIRQQNGEMVIYRPTEMKSATIKGRKFTAPTTKSAATDISANQYINRSGNVSDIHCVEGGTLRANSPARKIIIHQDYGNKDSWIDNYQFNAETFKNEDFDYWTRYHGLVVKPISDLVKGEKDGIAIHPINASPRPYISVDFGTGSVASLTDQFVLSFEYGFYNDSASTINNVQLKMDIRQGAKHLTPEGSSLIWTTNEALTIGVLQNIDPGWSGWTTYEKTLTGLDTSGLILITLYPHYVPDAYICIKNIRLYAISTQVQKRKVKKSFRQRIREKDPSKFIWSGWGSKYNIVDYTEEVELIAEQTLTIENDIEGDELDYDYILGDVRDTVSPDPGFISNDIENIMEQFQGSLGTWILGVIAPSETWSTRGNTESLPLLELIGHEIAHQYSRPKQLLTLPIHEKNAISNNPKINLIGNFQDNLNKYNLYNRIFVLNSAIFEVEERVWNIDLVEIAQDAPTFPTPPDAPSAPLATAATMIDTTLYTANWEASIGAIRYYLDISESNVFASFVPGFENLNVGNNLSYQVTGATAETAYYYRVRAYDIWGQTSASSNTITMTTLASTTYQLHVDTRFFLIPESTTWTVLVHNLSPTAVYNNNFRLKLVGTADGTPVTYTAITADFLITGNSSEYIVGTWDVEITGFDWDKEYTLSIEYDSNESDYILLGSKTYN